MNFGLNVIFFGKSADADDDDDVSTTLESGQAPIPIVPRDQIRRKGKPLTST